MKRKMTPVLMMCDVFLVLPEESPYDHSDAAKQLAEDVDNEVFQSMYDKVTKV